MEGTPCAPCPARLPGGWGEGISARAHQAYSHRLCLQPPVKDQCLRSRFARFRSWPQHTDEINGDHGSRSNGPYLLENSPSHLISRSLGVEFYASTPRDRNADHPIRMALLSRTTHCHFLEVPATTWPQVWHTTCSQPAVIVEIVLKCRHFTRVGLSVRVCRISLSPTSIRRFDDFTIGVLPAWAWVPIRRNPK